MWFEVIFGLKVNIQKSKLIPIGIIDNLEELAAKLCCQMGGLPST